MPTRTSKKTGKKKKKKKKTTTKRGTVRIGRVDVETIEAPARKKKKAAGGMERVHIKKRMSPAARRRHREIDENPDPDLMRQALETKQQCEANQRAFADVMSALHDVREAAGVSLSELEKRTDIGKGRLSVLFNGSGNPTLETVSRIAKALDCDVTVSVTVPT